jgi:hypothetical protein
MFLRMLFVAVILTVVFLGLEWATIAFVQWNIDWFRPDLWSVNDRIGILFSVAINFAIAMMIAAFVVEYS